MTNSTGERSTTPLRGARLDEITALMQRMGEPAWRASQAFQWIFERGVRTFDEMTNLSKALRERLSQEALLGGLELVETVGEPDSTQKLVFRTHDGQWVETVIMRGEEEPDAEEEPRGSTPAGRKVSVCLSSQIGCPLRCAFCLTGYYGYVRNLGTDEIVDQLLWVRRILAEDERVAHVVFMGMGEPMLNLGAVRKSIEIFIAPQSVGLTPRKISVSTAGVLEGIETLGREGPEVNLAVSLNATTQEERDRLMPGCKAWPLNRLGEACRRFPLGNRRRITFEYVLLRGRNDSRADVKRLVQFTHALHCKINLICFNPDEALGFQPTPDAEAEAFRDALASHGVPCSLRRSKGIECGAACGQLAAHARRRRT